MSPVRIGNVLSWASDLEDNTMAQAQRTAAMPFVLKPLALMPDAHLGIGATVGSVIATEHHIMPAAVGVDIGCGMAATRLKLTANDLPDDLDPLLHRIGPAIPSGVGKGHDRPTVYDPFDLVIRPMATQLSEKDMARARAQFGTLGSGNHFVEVCLDERQQVWIVLHSGSRGVGNYLAQIHMKAAAQEVRELKIKLEDPSLAYLAEGTETFDDYIADLLWAQEYARLNRSIMMRAAVAAMSTFLDRSVRVEQVVNCHHNFTQVEQHQGKRVWVTRKGAISAIDGQWGIIPGSMGTETYIVRGKGNPDSYHSCSHGAGRRMSRSAAKKTLTAQSLVEAMEGKTWNADSAKALVDEHPLAYKDITQVMADQEDLVETRHVLRQVLNYKGW